ncbi:YdbL family protein [Sphingomonas sanxanigenens]|uniref:DUF1318 domain-containing protein n=1 Tax=Sphingomonas sanxanigenens DSM 19645 = NX02 TaxID=1123269 RepID=W0A1L8_9SPHN|nr:YdbL family protein [Sphingomonas sanxanigenens]AHE51829.1 hypothetical protein NX02_00300 [Sphingomonas sanxanigenens DSM 19645 = NX02]
MTNRMIITAVAGIALAMAAGIGGIAYAQSGAVAAAISAGTVGEQADGYLGVRGSVSADVRAEVESINIKRRDAYTDLAAKRGVSVAAAAAATGCRTLATRVGPGQAYRLLDGSWQVRQGSAPVQLPANCPG